MEEFRRGVPKDIGARKDELLFGVDLHPQTPHIAVATVLGEVKIYEYAVDNPNTLVNTFTHHSSSVRRVQYTADGSSLYTASSDASFAKVDVETGKVVTHMKNAHGTAINALEVFEHYIFTGDDDGVIKLWDTRKNNKPAIEVKQNEDYITDFSVYPDKYTLLATAGDEHMAVIDYRKGKVLGFSEDQEDELMSVTVLKNGNKVVVGSQLGVLLIFSWGQWLDTTDRYPGHPGPINSIVTLDEETIITGCEDGYIRVVSILPNKLLGIVGSHRSMPVESMALSRDKRLMATCAHNGVKFWNVGFLFDDDGEEDEEDEEDDDDDDDESGENDGNEEQGENAENDENAGDEADSEANEDKDSDEESSGDNEDDEEEENEDAASDSKKDSKDGNDNDSDDDFDYETAYTSRAKKAKLQKQNKRRNFFADL